MKKITSLLSLLIIANIAFAQTPAPKIKVIRAGTMIDTETGKVLKNQTIIIENNIIKSIGTNLPVPDSAELIDLSNSYVLPGLIDCHTHLTFEPSNDYYADIFRTTTADLAIKAPIYAKTTLMAGFTSCRDLGGNDLIDISLRNAIDNGTIPGPRLKVAAFTIGATGGHADMTGFNPHIHFGNEPEFTGVADGKDEIIKKVRNNVKWGADVIKFCATAGVLSEEESVGDPQYSFEEMKALVDEAHRWHKKVAAHAHGTEGIKLAVKAGVNSVEHASILDDETINLMKQNGTYMAPTLYELEYIIEAYGKKGYPEKILDKARSISKQKLDCFAKAVKAGVKIAYGTDAAVMPHGLNGKDFAMMVKAGMTPMQAIQSATVNAADLMDVKAKVGSIAVGKYADIIAVDKDPLTDITILENVKFVMKDGVVYKNEIGQ